MAARNDWEKHLQGSTYLPVYALLGSGALLVEEAVNALKAKVLQGPKDFNSDAFTAGSQGISQVLQAAGTLPMLAPKRWVHLSQVQRLDSKDQTALLAYIQRPASSTIFCLSGEKLDMRTKLGQSLGRGAAVFAFETPRLSEIATWVEKRAALQGYRIDSDAAALLTDLIGADLGLLVQSLQKVALYAGAQQTLCSEHVAEAVAATRIASIFELTDAVGQRHFAKASLLLHNLLAGGESGLLILAMLVRQLRQLVQLKGLANVANAQVARTLRVRPFVVDALRQQAQNFSQKQLLGALRTATAADAQLKSSRLSHGLILDGLLAQLVMKAA